MFPISYRRHRFPPAVIQHAVWLYLRFTLSYRDVEELLAERGLDISYESVRSWVLKFGPMIARNLRRCGPRPSDRWHLDEMVVRIAGKHVYLWRAVDHEGEVLETHCQENRLLDRSGFGLGCRHDSNLLSPALLSAGRHPARRLAVPSFHPKLSRC